MKRCLIVLFSLIFTAFSSDCFAESRHFTIDGDHGKLAVIMQIPDTEIYPAVIIMHGFNSHKEMPLLKQIADKLEMYGIASVRFDFNGHGQSAGRFEDMTIPNELNDAKLIYEYISKQPQISSVSLTGHSQGGLIASLLAGEYGADKIKSVVLLAPAAVLKDMALYGDLFGIKYDTKNLPEYVEIPGCCRVGRKYVETAKTLPIYEIAAKYTGPVLIIHGKADDVVPITYGYKYHEIYKNSEMGYFDGWQQANHLYSGYTDKVTDLTADFFKMHLK